MRAIIIGAGRGSRLGHETDEIPKTLVHVMGRPMLDWVLEALASAGFAKKDVIFISGYAEDVVRARYPELSFVRNAGWEKKFPGIFIIRDGWMRTDGLDGIGLGTS